MSIRVSLWIFFLLQILPKMTALIIVLDLFLCNHDLRKYWRRRLINFVLKQRE